MKSFIHRSILLSVMLSMGGLSGCASHSESQPQAQQKPKVQENWSTKEQSALPALTMRPEVDMGPHIAVQVSAENLQTGAIEILKRAADSTNPLLRANAIEGMKHAPHAAPEAIRKGLGDENRAVRFVATMLVGQLKLTDMRTLVEPLLKDESESVQAAAIYAVRRLGGKPDLNPLSRMLLGEDAEVRANAALVLGELGDPSAVSLLRYALGHGLLKSGSARRKIVEMQIAEAMVKLGDVQQLEVIRASLFSRPEEGEITALACQICGEVKDEASLPNLLDLATRGGKMQQSAEIRMAAALAASRIDPQQAILGVPTAYVGSPRFELRAQAAATFGATRQQAALQYLARQMDDPNPLVQVSAAAGVLEIEHAGP